MEKAIPELISGYFFLNVAILQQWRCHKVGGKLENRPKGSSQNNRVTSLPSSCPALSRVSTRSMPSAGPVDGRIKSGHDDGREDGGSFILFRPLSSRLENLTARSPLPGNFPPARRGSGLALFHADGYCSNPRRRRGAFCGRWTASAVPACRKPSRCPWPGPRRLPRPRRRR